MLYINKQLHIMKSTQQSTEILQEVTSEYDGHKLKTDLVTNTTNFSLNILGIPHQFNDVIDYDLLSIINIVNMINTQENYWEGFKKLCDDYTATKTSFNRVDDSIFNLFTDMTSIDVNHKKWFRNEKIDSIIND